MSRYYSENALTFATACLGDRLATLEKHPNEVDVVRFCGAIRNFHRFHYDQRFTVEQGIAGIIVPGFLIGNWCIEAVSRAFRPGIEISSLKFRNTKVAPVGDDYMVHGEVSSIIKAEPRAVFCSLEVKRQATDELVTTGVVGIRQSARDK